MVGIYKITSPSGKVYIGQSFDIEKRRNNYKFLGCKSQSKLYRSIIKYSWSNHLFEVIHELPKDVDLDTITLYEQMYMDLHRDCNIELMNLRDAGIQGRFCIESKSKLIGRPSPTKGRKQSEQTRQRRSESMKGIKKTDEHRQNMRNGRKTKDSVVWKDRLSAAQKERFKNSDTPNKIDRNSIVGIIDDYKNGDMTIEEMSIKYGVSKNTIDRFLRETNTPRRAKGNPGVKRNKRLKPITYESRSRQTQASASAASRTT